MNTAEDRSWEYTLGRIDERTENIEKCLTRVEAEVTEVKDGMLTKSTFFTVLGIVSSIIVAFTGLYRFQPGLAPPPVSTGSTGSSLSLWSLSLSKGRKVKGGRGDRCAARLTERHSLVPRARQPEPDVVAAVHLLVVEGQVHRG